MAGKTILVLGGGIGGQVVSRRLAAALGEADRVVVVDREERYAFPPSLLWAMVGDRRPEQFTRDLGRLRAKGVEVVHGEVTAINPEAHAVRVGDDTLAYDYLVVALGAQMNPDAVPGLREAALHPYDTATALRLHEALRGFRGGRIVVSIAGLPYRCPAAPHETALLIDAFLRKRGVRGATAIDLYSPEPLPMPVAGKAIGHAVARELAARDIGLHFGQTVEQADAAGQRLHFREGDPAPFDLLVAIPPHRPPPVVAESPLAGPLGWIPVDRNTLVTHYRDVYAIGDVTAIPLANGMMLPKAGVFAHAEAEAVARNIVRAIRGERGEDTFDGHGSCFLEVGGGKAGFATGDFFANPAPAVKMKGPSRYRHLSKVAFEKWWLRRWL